VGAAGDIGFCKIVSESGIAAGVRRIEALTGIAAVRYVQQLEDEQRQVASLVKAEGGSSIDRVERLLARQRELQREVETLQARINASASADLLAGVRELAGVKVLATQVEGTDAKGLRELADTLKERLGSGIIGLGSIADGKVALLVAVTKDLTDRFKAGDLIRELAPVVGGSGGGKPELAQAGGTKPENLAAALEKLSTLIGG
jgi:alanyl-tRNA synthetase